MRVSMPVLPQHSLYKRVRFHIAEVREIDDPVVGGRWSRPFRFFLRCHFFKPNRQPPVLVPVLYQCRYFFLSQPPYFYVASVKLPHVSLGFLPCDAPRPFSFQLLQSPRRDQAR